MLTEKRINLEALAALLQSPRLPIQTVIADEAGVEQSLVSRAKNGKLKRPTLATKRLWQYVNMQLGSGDVPEAIEGAVRSYLASGGDVDLLVKQVAILQMAISRSG